MKTIGMIGGTTWLSTVEYYSIINRLITEKLGGLHSAKILLYSMDFAEVKPEGDSSKWKQYAFEKFLPVAFSLEKAGADCLLFCANTPHMFANELKESIHIPFIHIAEATADEIKKHNFNKAALLGTRITMESSFYREKLEERGISVIIPDEAEKEFINDSIFNELAKEIFTEETKRKYLDIIERLRAGGAQAVILGCTEIPLIIKQEDVEIPLFDTTLIHSKAAVEFALSD